MALPKWAVTVTPFSKMLALSMLVIFPIIGFYLGMKYQEKIDINKYAGQNTEQIKNDRSGIANPASIYCREQGGKSEIITDSDGSQRGVCVFDEGKSCDEWEFYRTKICK